MSRLPKDNESGFTLVELMIAIVVSLVLMGIAVKMVIVQKRVFSVQEQISEMQQNVRMSMDMMVREIRMAGYDPKSFSFDGIQNTGTNTAIQIWSDIDGNGTITASSDEDVTFSLDTGDLQIERNGSGNPIAENITSLSFSYFDEDGITTAVLDDIRQVQIDITGRTEKMDATYPVNGGYRTFTLTSRVTPVNLGL